MKNFATNESVFVNENLNINEPLDLTIIIDQTNRPLLTTECFAKSLFLYHERISLKNPSSFRVLRAYQVSPTIKVIVPAEFVDGKIKRKRNGTRIPGLCAASERTKKQGCKRSMLFWNEARVRYCLWTNDFFRFPFLPTSSCLLASFPAIFPATRIAAVATVGNGNVVASHREGRLALGEFLAQSEFTFGPDRRLPLTFCVLANCTRGISRVFRLDVSGLSHTWISLANCVSGFRGWHESM